MWLSRSPKAEARFQKQVFAALYDPYFLKLMDDNGRLASVRTGGVDLDYDPVCQCQDGPDSILLKSVVRRGADFAAAHVANADCDDPSADCAGYVIVLRRLSGAWRIYDVIEKSGGVRARLERHNRCLRGPGPESRLDRCLD